MLGYKLRTHMAKSIQSRSKTIQRAVAEYNAAAAKLDPPRSPLDWTTVSHYSFLEEFNLLRDTRNDIRDKPWTRPGVREAMKLRRHIARAQEEIVRCNVELRRLHTGIRDEHRHFGKMLLELRRNDSPLYGAVEDFATRRRAINASILCHTYDTYALPGFSGNTTPGRRLGAPEDAEDAANDDSDLLNIQGGVTRPHRGDDDGDDGDNDEQVEAADGAIQVFSILSL